MRTWLDGSPDRVAVLHCKGPYINRTRPTVLRIKRATAGKGRSGTMACAFLLSLDVSPTPPQLPRSTPAKQWAERRADEWMEVMPADADVDQAEAVETEEKIGGNSVNQLDTRPPSVSSGAQNTGGSGAGENQPASSVIDAPTSETSRAMSVTSIEPSAPAAKNKTDPSPLLQEVLALHTSRRMRPSKDAEKPGKPGVSIPSQRRVRPTYPRLHSVAHPP
jgi:phosphatidylinositol-3,4,5-trisphosphate 3-phosphatase and dual-specificity protein phosphatase PTEN